MGQKETPQKQYVICLANYLYCALGRCMVFRFWLLGRLQTTPSGLQGVDGICDASLASRDCTLSTGEHKRVRSRMNSSKRFTVRYIGLLPLLA